MPVVRLIVALLLVLTTAPEGASQPRLVATTATLSVLGGEVEHVSAAGRSGRPGESVDLAVGDRVRTGADGRALITFLDGSTITVEPSSDVTIRQAEVTQRGSGVRLLVAAGTVWARLASWLGSRGSVSIESNAYTATAHDGLIGGQTRPDGSFVCWTRAGTLRLLRADGRRETTLQPGEKATAVAGRPALVEPFAVHQSSLEVVVTGPVLPLLVLPDGQRVAGFLDPGVEVNQVFGSLTAVRGDRGRIVEVPAGVPGTYRLVLGAVGDGSFEVSVIGRFRSLPVYSGGARGRARTGDRLVVEITQLVAEGEADPRTARVVAGGLGPLRALAEPPPGTVLLSPLELAGRR